MNRVLKVTIAGVIASLVSGYGMAKTYDLVINNGRVIDPETKLDAVRSVGIGNGVIEKISKKTLKGKDSIDAKGLVVSPGFIDTHTHSSDKYVIKMAMMDGVTTGMDFE